MLESNALFFCRLDKLGDPFEGSRPLANIEARSAFLKQALAGSDLNKDQYTTLLAQMAESETYFARAMRMWCAANCWQLGEHEYAAMWDVYVPSGAGVAIRSTFDRLKASLEGSETTVYLGEVTYIDYSKGRIPTENVMTPVMYKRKNFEHESELRAFVTEWVTDEDSEAMSAWDVGVDVDVDLGTLVERVHVSPKAPSWFAGLITARYGFGWEVVPSLLLEEPLF